MKVTHRIYAVSVGTSASKIQANPNRVYLFIQNNSVNTLYILSEGQSDTAQALIVPAAGSYENDKAPQGGFNLIASAASSDIRIQEVAFYGN